MLREKSSSVLRDRFGAQLVSYVDGWVKAYSNTFSEMYIVKGAETT